MLSAITANEALKKKEEREKAYVVDPELVKENKNKIIEDINVWKTKSTGQSLSLLIGCADYPNEPERSFFEELKKELNLTGFTCDIEKRFATIRLPNKAAASKKESKQTAASSTPADVKTETPAASSAAEVKKETPAATTPADVKTETSAPLPTLKAPALTPAEEEEKRRLIAKTMKETMFVIHGMCDRVADSQSASSASVEVCLYGVHAIAEHALVLLKKDAFIREFMETGTAFRCSVKNTTVRYTEAVHKDILHWCKQTSKPNSASTCGVLIAMVEHIAEITNF